MEDKGNNHGYLWHCHKPQELAMISLDEIFIHNISMGCTMAIRKTIRDMYLRHSDYSCPHDWECNLCAALQHGLAFYNAPLIRYRIHENNACGNDKLNHHNSIDAKEREKNANALVTFTQTAKGYLSEMEESYQNRIICLHAFHTKRLALLKDGTIRLWFSLLREIKIYHLIVSYRGMLADVMYAFKKIKLGK